MCSANGGCFIKVGQHIGALDYLVPLEYVQTMRVFHDNAPQSSVQDMYRVLKHDLGKDVSIFEHPSTILERVHACFKECSHVTKSVRHRNLDQYYFVLWIISTAGLGVRFGLRLGFQTLWLRSIMQNMFPLTQIQIRILFPQYPHSTEICV